jgi:glycosyltransferase involved in cell wall biosynthesis
MNKNVFILTNFNQYLRSYSPIIVVGDQLKMLKRAGYNPVLITSEGWNPPESTIFGQVRTERITRANVYGYPQAFNETDLEEIESIYRDLSDLLPDDATVITHDLIFLPDYVKHNVACRRISEEHPTIQWIHWIHSATSPNTLIQERAMYGDKYKELLNSKFPNSIVAYPNAYDIPRVAINYSYEEDEIFEVPHPMDPVEGMHSIVQHLYDEEQLWKPEVLMIYPLRLDRGKNADMNVRLMRGFKDIDVTSKLIFCDFQSTGDDKVVYREELRSLAAELGVADRVVFLSEADPNAQLEVPKQVVLDLFTLSNVFMMPSKSETYSLVTQEAMSRGNFCILNHDFAPFRQVYGKLAIYRQFSANIAFNGYDGEITTTHSDLEAFFKDIATNTMYWLNKEKTIMGKTWTRTERNLDTVFKKYLEPLLYGETLDE